MNQGVEVYFSEKDVGKRILVDGKEAIVIKNGSGNLAVIMMTGPNRISRTYAGCIEGFPINRLNGNDSAYGSPGSRVHFYPGYMSPSEPDTYESLLKSWLENTELA